MNFEVLEVNGQGVSEAEGLTALERIQYIAEPISLVIRRSFGQKKNLNQLFISSPPAPRCETSTQTENHRCFCGRLTQKDAESSYQSRGQTNSDSRQSTNNQNIHLRRRRSNFHHSMSCEEIVLQRPKKGQKLGITLCDDIDPQTKEAKVTVASIALASEAAKTEKIKTGDVILKIDDVPVGNMEEAAKVLDKKSSSYSFLIGRSQARSPIFFEKDIQQVMHHNRDNHDICSDVINAITANNAKLSIPVISSVTSQGHNEPTSNSKSPTRSPTIEKHPRSFQRILKYNRSQSLVGNVLIPNHDPPKQNSYHPLPRRSSYGDCLAIKNKNTSRPPIANDDFSYVKPKKYALPKRVSFSKENPISRLGMPQVLTNGSFIESKNDSKKVAEETADLHVKQRRNILLSTSTVGELEEWGNGGLSPWVQIARRDYENKLKQLKKDNQTSKSSAESKSFERVTGTCASPSSPSTPTDNTSSAYSTGESFRSTSSNSETRISGGKKSTSRVSSTAFPDPGQESVSSCYTSSDANSDGEDPACYLTHLEEGSESEGFEDARIEFRSLFSALSSSDKPLPISRILHPPHESLEDFKFHSCPSSADSEINTAARNEQSSICSEVKNIFLNSKSQNSANDSASSRKSDQNETRLPNFSIPIITISDEDSNETSKSINDNPNDHNKLEIMSRNHFRRKSEHALPIRRHFPAQRSISCVESRELRQSDNDGSIPMAWKVRIRKDGTRYITKRPIGEKTLRHRERRIQENRSAPTSDDDQTEVKLGRHWSRDDRKRHFRVAREKKLRRDFMQRRRLEALNENSQVTDQIVELSHVKMSKHKQKRMLFDNFVTVQELLAHGNRTGDVTELNPLLSVSYI